MERERKIEYKRPDGRLAEGWLAEPIGGTGPGIVVIQEWWGVNEQIKGVARKFAHAGYRALVPDLYRGKRTVEAEEAEHLMQGLDFGDAATQDIRGAALYLREQSSAVGVTGFCMGGALTLLTLCNVAEVAAAVCWYGMPPLEYIDASKINAPLMGHFATKDEFFPIANVDRLEEKLRTSHATFEFFRYDAKHAFANETAIGMKIPAEYDARAAELAWSRTMPFLAKHLR